MKRLTQLFCIAAVQNAVFLTRHGQRSETDNACRPGIRPWLAALPPCLVLVHFLVAELPAADVIRHRLVILADMGNEPDEEQQMTHMLIMLKKTVGRRIAKTVAPKTFTNGAA